MKNIKEAEEHPAKGIVLNYCTQWNAIERDLFERHAQEEELLKAQLPLEAYCSAPRTKWFEIMESRIRPLYNDFVTDRKRVYGCNSSSFGYPAKYNGVEEATVCKVDVKNRNRVEVYIETTTNLDDEYLFVLLNKAGQWRIDSYKHKRFKNADWSKGIL